MKTGKIYLEVATSVLRRKYPDMTAERLSELLSGTFNEVEAFAEAKAYVEAACCTIRRVLEAGGVLLPHEFGSYVLWSETPEKDLASNELRYIANGFREECKGEIAYRALSSVHDTWVRRNETLFFDEQYIGRRFLFLRTEMIGYEALVEEYMPFVEPILRFIGFIPRSDHFIKQAYKSAKQRMVELYNIRCVDDLAFLIRRGDYQPLTAMIINTMNNDLVASALAKQAIERMSA